MSYVYEDEELDSRFDEVAQLVFKTEKVSASLMQRRLKLGYARAARVIDQLEKAGIVGPANGARPRQILISKEEYEKGAYKRAQVEERQQQSEEIPIFKWTKVKPSQIKNKILADYVTKAKDFEILLGKDNKDELVTLDMKQAGNVIISGSQFTNVKQLVNQIIVSASLKWSDDDLKIILMDGTYNELYFPTGTGQLLTPLITNMEKCVSALKWAVCEAENRLKLLADHQKAKLPNILIVLHGFEEIFAFSSNEIEDNLVRLQRLGRKTGIYILLTVNVVSFTDFKLIISNNSARIAFKPVDDRFKERNLPQVDELKGPDEAVLWSLYQENKKFEILKIKPKKIYRKIFKK